MQTLDSRPTPSPASPRPDRSVRTVLVLGILALLLWAAMPIRSTEAEDMLSKLGQSLEASEEPWRIEADRLEGRHEADVLEAFGNVRLTHGEDYLEAEYARYYRATNWVYLKGDVEARWGDDLLRAEEAEFDLRNQVGWLKQGDLFVEEPHVYMSGELIKKRFGETYEFRQAEVTACDARPAPWSFTAGQGDVTVDGYALLQNVQFQILDRPVAYSPIFTVPLKTTRQSGFLLPEIGTSDNLGFHVNLPFYWAIDEESDATFYENFMSRRGLMQGLEVRHRNDFFTKGLWRFDWLLDSEVAEREADEIDILDDDGLVRNNKNRWWIRGMLDHRVPASDWEIKVNLDIVSDQNYLREFDAGLSGFEETREDFVRNFGRDINENDQDRTSTFLLYRSFEPGALAGLIEYNHSVEYGHGNLGSDKDPSLHRLPEFKGFLYKQALFDTPLEIMAEGSLANFYRRYGTKGMRMDLHPSVSLPLSSDYGAIIPSLGLRQTFYSIEKYENQPDGDEGSSTPARALMDFHLDAFSELFRVYELDNAPLDPNVNEAGDWRWTHLKHNIQPRVAYDYIPKVDQSRKPLFDELDRIEPRNELTYSLTQVMSRKRELLGPAGKDQEPSITIDYLDFLRLRVEQSFDFREATRDEDREQYERRPFSDILVDLEVKPLNYLSLVSRSWFSPYLGEFTEHEHFLALSHEDYGVVSFGIDYLGEIDEFDRRRDEAITMLRLGATWYATPQIIVDAYFRADLEAERDLEKELAVTYRHQCFDVQLSYSHTSLDQRFEIQINLIGLDMF